LIGDVSLSDFYSHDSISCLYFPVSHFPVSHFPVSHFPVSHFPVRLSPTGKC